jgi:tRNA pseudouridine13 synthase
VLTKELAVAREYSMGGTYRKILHRPADLTYSILRYDDPNFPLAQADEDTLLGMKLPEPPEDGNNMALKVEMTLGSSSYATMALREVLKSETSSAAQSALSREVEQRETAKTAMDEDKPEQG